MSEQGATIDFLCEAGHYALTMARAKALTQWGIYAPYDASARVPAAVPHCDVCRAARVRTSFGERMAKFYRVGERVSELRNVAYATNSRLLYAGTFVGLVRAIKVEGARVSVLFALDVKRARNLLVLDKSQVPPTHLRFFKLPDGTPVVCVQFEDGNSDHPNLGPVTRDSARVQPVLLQ